MSTLALGSTVVPLLETGDCPLLRAYGQPDDCFACIIYLYQGEQIGSFVTTVSTNGAIGIQRVQSLAPPLTAPGAADSVIFQIQVFCPPNGFNLPVGKQDGNKPTTQAGPVPCIGKPCSYQQGILSWGSPRFTRSKHLPGAQTAHLRTNQGAAAELFLGGNGYEVATNLHPCPP